MKISIFCILIGFSSSLHAQPVLFKHGLVPAAPPGAETLAAYMDIENSSNMLVIINHVQSPDFENVEIHLSGIKNGIAHMSKQNELAIPGKTTLRLEQGGLHLMLIKPKRDLFPGDHVTLILTQSDHTEHVIELSVKRLKANPVHQHH